jgi:hypothetical protein
VNTAKNKKIVFTVAAVVVVVVALSVYLIVTNTKPIPIVKNIVNETFTVNPDSFTVYNFSFPTQTTATIDGTFQVANDSIIEVYIMDGAGFLNWQKGYGINTYFYSGASSNGSISATLPVSTTYHLIFKNAQTEPKQVTAYTSISYVPEN